MVTKPTKDTPKHLTNARPKDERPQGKSTGPAGGYGYLNEKQEKFCHFIAMGKTQAEAAKLAGYSGHAANASRLAGIPAIQERVKELREVYQNDNAIKLASAKAEIDQLIRDERLDLRYFIVEFRQNLEMARTNGDIKTANDCLTRMAQMLGFAKSKDDAPGDDKKNDAHTSRPIQVSITNQLAQQVDRTAGIPLPDPDSIRDGAFTDAQPMAPRLRSEPLPGPPVPGYEHADGAVPQPVEAERPE